MGHTVGGEARTEGAVSGANREAFGKSTETSEEREERQEIRQEGERAEMADSLGKGDTLVREGIEPVERNSEERHRQEH